jgi:branched-chain amino acid transport system substrate-binding protein
VVDDPASPDARPDDQAIAALLAFRPDVVVFDSGDALMNRVFVPLETRWPERAPRPLYAGALPLPAALFPFVGRSVARRRRFFGLTNVSTTTANARLVTHFNETFADKVTRTATPNGSYDAFYLLAYGVVALGDEPVTGPSLSRAIGRLLPPGKPVDVGPLAILDGLGALRGGANIDLEGTIGHLDFDPATGEAPVDMAILCVGVDRTGVATEGIESGMVYDAHADKLVGELACP